jgi:hypothetical protein
MSTDRTFFVNGIPALYDALKKAGREKEGKKIVEDFLMQSFKIDISEKIERLLNTGIAPIPADLKYFGIYAELIQLYISGLFYSTVVLAGTLCERICFDILSTQKIQVEGNYLSEDQISCLYDRDFSRNVTLLSKWGAIEEETHDEMFQVYQKRIAYAHPKMKNINPKKDALDMIKKVTKILVNEFVKKPSR